MFNLSKKGGKKDWINNGLMNIFKILAVAAVLAGLAAGFIYLDKYVDKTVRISDKTALVELVAPPSWLTAELKQKIYQAITADGLDLKLSDTVASHTQQNLKNYFSWTDNVRVEATSKSILIYAHWRKPIGVIICGNKKYYVDYQSVVMDYVPMPNLPTVQINGLGSNDIPEPGQVWYLGELDAAMAILNKLDQMDQNVTSQKRLLYELESIDVSNFNGRKKAKEPHIVMYSKDKTQILWGAEFGTWQRHLEASDEEKLAKLYSYFRESGSVQSGQKFIDLQKPGVRIPQPIDKL
jgi:hypothetical protein